MDSPIVSEAVRGDVDALAFLHEMAFVLHWYDDLVDRDRWISDDTTHNAMWRALVTLPRNAFYRAHFEELNPILVSAIANWRIANVLERQREPSVADLAIAFVTRSTYVDLVTMCATIIGGVDWAVEQGVAIRRWAHSEGFARYLDNLAAEKAARKG